MKPKPLPNPSRPGSIRLRSTHWAKLRELMQFYGNRQWLESAIEREWRRTFK